MPKASAPHPFLALQSTIGNRAVARIAEQVALQRKYDAIPNKDQWKKDSDIGRFKKRSPKVAVVDTRVEAWNARTGAESMKDQRYLLSLIINSINDWRSSKGTNTAEAERAPYMTDLLDVVTNLRSAMEGQQRTHLRPEVQNFIQAGDSGDIAATRAAALALFDPMPELYFDEVKAALLRTKADPAKWSAFFFGSPPAAFGAVGFGPANLIALTKYDWLTTSKADEIITDFLRPLLRDRPNDVMLLLQNLAFRKAVQSKATPITYKGLADSMPLLRIAGDVESKGIDTAPTTSGEIDTMVQAVFDAFIGDLPLSSLIYSTNSGGFQVSNFLTGTLDSSIGAPCMMLSSVFQQLLKAVTSAAPAVMNKEDLSPMLTRPLAGIGVHGILTREAAFKGNVQTYGDLTGYDAINRIFFGDGHVWLEVNGREYDPTLGISGPVGTVAAAVEKRFTAAGKKFTAGDFTVTRTNNLPPGGARLHFDRTVRITEKKKKKK